MPHETQHELIETTSGSEMQPMHSREVQEDVWNQDDEDDQDISTSTLEVDNRLNKRTLLKLDCILLPFVSILFCLNSLDKTNIGNAETAGFSRDAGLNEGDINVAMAFFFAFFVALQPVGAAFGRKIGMARWVPACMSLWGLCTILHIWVRHRWQLVLLRIVIAILEAGFYPTTVSYLSLFYTRYEFALRLGFFYGQAAVSGALGGVLSWVVFSRFSNAPSEGVKPWQVLFVVEGSITLVVALIGFVWLPHSAGDAWFFSASERSWAERRITLDRDEAVSSITQDSTLDGARTRLLGEEAPKGQTEHLTADAGLQRHDIASAFFQYKIWHLLVCNILSAIPATAFGIFLPIIIKAMSPDLNISPAASNLLAVPPFAFGALVLLAFTYWSDRSHRRLVPILAGLIILLLGLSITVWIPIGNLTFRYIGLCILLSGSYIASPLTVAWIANNTPEPGKRAILLGINGWGNLAGISSGFLFTPEDARGGYATSFGVTLVCVAISFIGYAFFMLFLGRQNANRAALIKGWSPGRRQREAQYGDVDTGMRRGDERLTYRYTY